MTLADNLERDNLITEKYFTYYVPDTNGFISFGDIPKSIIKDEKDIDWAPLWKEGNNAWSVAITDIRVDNS
jgi:hypothetical protein